MKASQYFTAAWIAVACFSSLAAAASDRVQQQSNDPSWEQIERNWRLYIAWPQVTFARPDRGISIINYPGLCEITVAGVEMIRTKSPITPCARYSPVGGSSSSVCLEEGSPVHLFRPKYYRAVTCDRWDTVSSVWTCMAESEKDFTIESTRQVEVFTRVSDHDNGWGGRPTFKKSYSLEPCSN